MIVRLALLLVVAGCGRHAFDPRLPEDDAGLGPDATPCAPVGHDEDGDALDDACDPCPHLAGDRADADGDGVGDACDPSSARVHAVAFFDPFTVPRPEWSAPLPLAGGQLVPPIGYEEPRLELVPGRDAVTIAGSLGANASLTSQVSIIVFTLGGVYYCELYEVPPLKHGAVYFDGTDYVTVDDAYVDASLENAAFTSTIVHAPGEKISCTTTWPGLATVSGPLVDLGAPTHYALTLDEVDVRLDYLIVIREL